MFLSKNNRLKVALKYYAIIINDGVVDESLYHHSTVDSFKRYCCRYDIKVSFINPTLTDPVILYKKDSVGQWYTTTG